MENYNGKFEHSFFVVIEASDHSTCLKFSKFIRKAIEPWFFQIDYTQESKSARKGDVLRRDIYIRHIAYATDMIIFNEMLRALIWNYNLFFDVEISIDDRGTIPVDSRANLLR